MRICPHCGYQNEEAAAMCTWCQQPLPPRPPGVPGGRGGVPGRLARPAPIPLPRAAASPRGWYVRWFVLGAGLGLIPAAIYAFGAATYGLQGLESFGTVAGPGWPTIGCYLLPVLFLITGIFLSVRRFRPLGYGLLAAAIISPVVVAVSCVAAPKV